jgi:sugar phosphate isomerase/epimerase
MNNKFLKMERKDFIKTLSLVTAGGVLLPQEALSKMYSTKKNLEKIGIQLFSIANSLEQDFIGTITSLAQIGYKEIELFGPYPFSAISAQERWKTITPMLGFSGSGYFGQKENELKAIFKDLGLTIPAIHTDLGTLENHMDRLGKAAATLNFEYVILPAIPEERRQTLDGYKRIAQSFNSIGKAAKEVGLKLAYHNHGYGLKEMEGQIPVQMILENTDPGLVFFEMDLVWTLAGNADPIYYLNTYKNRYKLMHVKDMSAKKTFPGDGSTPKDWMEIFPLITTLGTGVVDIPSIVSTAHKNGVKHFFIEYERAPEPEVTFKNSFDYLSTIPIK